MVHFVLIETNNGFEISKVMPGQAPKDAATLGGGELVDRGAYRNYADAAYALETIEMQEQDNDALG